MSFWTSYNNLFRGPNKYKPLFAYVNIGFTDILKRDWAFGWKESRLFYTLTPGIILFAAIYGTKFLTEEHALQSLNPRYARIYIKDENWQRNNVYGYLFEK